MRYGVSPRNSLVVEKVQSVDCENVLDVLLEGFRLAYGLVVHVTECTPKNNRVFFKFV